MSAFINLTLMKEPINWLIVGVIILFWGYALALLTRNVTVSNGG